MLKTGIYYESWASQWWGDTIDLENPPEDTGIVYLSFCEPFPTGEFGGLEFFQAFSVVQQAVKTAKQKGVLVMLSVGGGAYKFATAAPFADYDAVVDLAQRLGCDGIDIDWEPDVESLGRLPDCDFGTIIHEFRAAGWSGMKLSCAGLPAGAAPVVPGNLWRGLNLKGLKSNGHELDFVNIMAYDSGKNYDAIASFNQYRAAYSGPLYLGIELGVQGWGDEITSTEDVQQCADHAAKDGNAGLFIWAWHKDPTGSPTVEQVISIAEGETPATFFACPNCNKTLNVFLA